MIPSHVTTATEARLVWGGINTVYPWFLLMWLQWGCKTVWIQVPYATLQESIALFPSSTFDDLGGGARKELIKILFSVYHAWCGWGFMWGTYTDIPGILWIVMAIMRSSILLQLVSAAVLGLSSEWPSWIKGERSLLTALLFVRNLGVVPVPELWWTLCTYDTISNTPARKLVWVYTEIHYTWW